MEYHEKIKEVEFGEDDECSVTGQKIRDENAEEFLDAWMKDRTQVAAGLFYYQDKFGLYVAIDNKTDSGHMKAFDNIEDCRNWLETTEFQYRRNQRKSYKPTFGNDSWNSKNTILAGSDDLRKICIEHGWLNASSVEDMTKIMMANSCGWPLDHLATMIWMGSDYRKDLNEPINFAKAGEQRNEIRAVLTQHRDRMLYNSMVCDKIGELEKAGEDIPAYANHSYASDDAADFSEYGPLGSQRSLHDEETIIEPKSYRSPKR